MEEVCYLLSTTAGPDGVYARLADAMAVPPDGWGDWVEGDNYSPQRVKIAKSGLAWITELLYHPGTTP